jgi:hypothetical protein
MPNLYDKLFLFRNSKYVKPFSFTGNNGHFTLLSFAQLKIQFIKLQMCTSYPSNVKVY